MSAGTGIFHSEFNHLPDKTLKLFQIWVFPERRNLPPRYDQKTFDPAGRQNQWQRLVSPNEPEAVKIVQKAYFSRVLLDEGKSIDYSLKAEGNGMYVFMIDGSTKLGELQLDSRDGCGIWEAGSITLTAVTKADILMMEVPMQV